VVLDDKAREIPPPVHNRGYSATREQAMADFKARWKCEMHSQLFYGVLWGVSLWFLRAAENEVFLRDFQIRNCLKETECAVSFRSVENMDQSEESEGPCRNSGY
jgi:hypothetical protein